MKVSEKLTFANYWRDKRFRKKKPRHQHKGDNIYEPIGSGFRQHGSEHTSRHKKGDLSGRWVLVSSKFVYFGSQPHPLPGRFKMMIVGRGHKRFSQEDGIVDEFAEFFESLPKGRRALPRDWPVEKEASRGVCRQRK